jgi:predicted transcriptional regulator
MVNSTTIQVSVEVKNKLEELKLSDRDTFNDVIEDLIEDTMELSEETKRELEEALAQVERGEVISHEDLGKELGFSNV